MAHKKLSGSQQFAAQIPAFLRRPTTRNMLNFGLLWGAAWLVLSSFFLASVLKDQNYLELFPNEMVFPLLQHGLTALLIAAATYVFRPTRFIGKLPAAMVLALLLANYDDRLQQISGPLGALIPLPPSGNEQALISVCFLVLVVALSLQLGKLFERWVTAQRTVTSGNLIGGLMVAVLFVFLSQAVSVARMLPTIERQSNVTAPLLPAPANGVKPTQKPDIYYLVFDRYANQKVLEEQFGFDNKAIASRLWRQGFVAPSEAYANYPFTAQSVASTLNSTYLHELTAPFRHQAVQSRTLYHNLIYQSSVVKALKEQGYQYHHIGSWYGASNNAPQADSNPIFEHNVMLFGRELRRLSGLEAATFKQSPYYRLATIKGLSWWPLKTTERYGSELPKAQLEELHRLSNTSSDQPRFVFAHILLPHDPFYFNADGSLSAYIGNDDYGKPIKQKYTDQVQFVNQQIRQLVDRIQQNSGGQAVILINPDEGPYPDDLNKNYIQAPDQAIASRDTNMQDWRTEWLQIKYGIFQAVHIPKATPEDYVNLSSVNLFRIVLNRYFGYQLPYLPNCHFGLTKGAQYQFEYTDITPKLTGQSNPACSQFNSN